MPTAFSGLVAFLSHISEPLPPPSGTTTPRLQVNDVFAPLAPGATAASGFSFGEPILYFSLSNSGLALTLFSPLLSFDARTPLPLFPVVVIDLAKGKLLAQVPLGSPVKLHRMHFDVGRNRMLMLSSSPDGALSLDSLDVRCMLFAAVTGRAVSVAMFSDSCVLSSPGSDAQVYQGCCCWNRVVSAPTSPC